MDIAISNRHCGLVVTTAGGSVWRFFAKREGAEVPIFRAPPPGEARAPLASGCFPLVPFGNRVRGNRFAFEGREHRLEPNTDRDPHYLHGDGWTSDWSVLDAGESGIRLGLEHRDGGTPYAYSAEQAFALDGPALVMTLSVTNRGPVALPFGLGWHPFFPLTPGTVLTARTAAAWDEDRHWLPTSRHPTAGDLDFSEGRPLPRRWVNTPFEGWDGRATIRWPEQDLAVRLTADPLFDRSLVFVSDPAFDPGYAYDFFCLEPMSHGIDGHNSPGGAGLRRLAPGESLAGRLRIALDPAPDGGAIVARAFTAPEPQTGGPPPASPRGRPTP